MKRVLLLLITFSLFAFTEDCDTITRLNHNPAFVNAFQLREGDVITQLSSIGAVDKGIIYGNQKVADDALVIIDVNTMLKGGSGDPIKTLASIPRPGSNSEGSMPIKKRGNTLFFVDSTTLNIYDVSTASAPQKLYDVSVPTEIEEMIFFNNDTIFLTEHGSDKEKELFHTVTYDGTSAPTISNTQKYFHVGLFTSVNNKRLIAINYTHIFRWNQPLEVKNPDGNFKHDQVFMTAKTIGDYCYFSTSEGVIVFNNSKDINNLEIVDTLDAKGTNLYEYKGLLFVGGDVGIPLDIFDISNPNNIVKKAIFTEDQTSYKGCYSIDTSRNHLYMITEGNNDWIDVLDISSYLPVLTEKKDTTHAIKKDTTTKKDTIVVLDTIVTTLVKEVVTDSMFIKTDSLTNGVVFKTIFDTTVAITSTTLDSTVDTLHKDGIIQVQEQNNQSFMVQGNKSLQITLPSSINGAGTLSIFDLSGQLIDRQEILTTGNRTILWEMQKQTVATGLYIAVVSVDGQLIKTRFRVR